VDKHRYLGSSRFYQYLRGITKSLRVSRAKDVLIDLEVPNCGPQQRLIETIEAGMRTGILKNRFLECNARTVHRRNVDI
jgi:hypothetical protein